MKKLITFFCTLWLIMLASFANGQSTSLSFTQSSTADIQTSGRGTEYWNAVPWTNSGNTNGVTINGGNETSSFNMYYRFLWNDFETTTQGVYDFTEFDNKFHRAMDYHQMFSFRIQPFFVGTSHFVVVGGANLAYPQYAHTLFQAETNKDWIYTHTDGSKWWIINWNSAQYLARWKALMLAVAAHVNSTSYQPSWSASPIAYTKVLYQVDAGGYGNFGEAHMYPWYNASNFPAYGNPTAASLDTLWNYNLQAFPNNPNMMLIGILTNHAASFVPASASYYYLTTGNAWGKGGIRRDNLADSGYDNILKNNDESFNGVNLKDLIMNQYKFAPWNAEPLNGAGSYSCGSPYCDIVREVNTYHIASFGNGNLTNPALATTQTNIRNASAASGFRYTLTGGSMTTSLVSNGAFNVTLNWSNTGICPTYERWNTVFELRTSGGSVVWTGNSSFDPKPMLPGSLVQSDNFTLGSVANGTTYSLYIILKDPNAYKLPLALGITGRGSDGAYLVRSNITVGPASNIPPTAVITPSPVNLTLPTSSQLFSGTSSTDPDGSITAYSWTQVSGPNTATRNTPTASTCTMSGMIAGTYIFKLTVTDNGGATGSQNVTVNVNNANVPPTAVITPTGTSVITLPTSSINLSGTSSTDPDGTISSYAWSFVSGPNTPTVGTPTASTSTISGMISGTYIIRLTVTDNSGGTGSIDKTIFVNIAPTAQITSSTSITLPVNSCSLDATQSFDPDGTVTNYSWSQISGPNTGSFSTASSSITNFSGLIAGTYNVKLVVTDNNGATGNDTLVLVVNPAVTGELTVFTTQTPPLTIHNDGQPLELGMKFRSSINTYVTGIRFYKVVGNNGTHVGELYDASGNRLASATFFTESSSGWQSVYFQTPVAIAANTTYMACYFSPGGYYIYTSLGFNSAITNSTLTGLADGTDGFNGMYEYSPTPTFPTSHSVVAGGKVNYWVDVITNASAVIAEAGLNQLIYIPAASIILDAGRSQGNITSYLWTQLSGPNTPTIANATSATTKVTGLIPGSYVFQLSLNGGSSLDQITVDVYMTGARIRINGAKPKTKTQ